MKSVEAEIEIKASPGMIISAFTDPRMLKDWWGVERHLIQLKQGGLYSLAWNISKSGFGYVSTGIVREYKADKKLHIEDFAYFNPERDILGPMSLLITASATSQGSVLYICQDGYQQGADWEWYHQAVQQAWPKALESIKNYIESQEG